MSKKCGFLEVNQIKCKSKDDKCTRSVAYLILSRLSSYFVSLIDEVRISFEISPGFLLVDAAWLPSSMVIMDRLATVFIPPRFFFE